PAYVVNAPTGLSAQYLSEEDEVQVSWNAFELPDDIDEEVKYIVSVNGQENVQTDTDFTISNPPREELTITVAVQVKGETGPAAEVNILVQEPEEEESEEEKPEEEESEETEKPEATEEPEENENTGEDSHPEEEENDDSNEPENNTNDENNETEEESR